MPIEIPQPNEFPTASRPSRSRLSDLHGGPPTRARVILIRRDLAGEAIGGRVLAGLLPREPEVRGLVALMELQASRFDARTGPDGSKILLEDQDRRRWDRILITRGLAALDRSIALRRPLGPYTASGCRRLSRPR